MKYSTDFSGFSWISNPRLGAGFSTFWGNEWPSEEIMKLFKFNIWINLDSSRWSHKALTSLQTEPQVTKILPDPAEKSPVKLHIRFCLIIDECGWCQHCDTKRIKNGCQPRKPSRSCPTAPSSWAHLSQSHSGLSNFSRKNDLTFYFVDCFHMKKLKWLWNKF